MNKIYIKTLLFLINKLNIFNNTDNKWLQNNKVRMKKMCKEITIHIIVINYK